MSRVLAYPAAPQPVARRLLGFVRLLRDNGFAVGIREGEDALALADGIDLSRPHALRRGLRALLCSCRADWRRFDDLFDAFWRRRGVKRAARVAGDAGRRRMGPPRDGAADGPPGQPDRVDRGAGGDPADGHGRHQGASAAETLAVTDLRHIVDPEDLARVNALTERLAARMRYRLTRRTRVHARGRRIDLRNTIHRSIRHGGTPLDLAFRRRRQRPLRLVVILDVSGSMSLYSTFFVRFIRGVIDNFREADAFVFHTRLVPIGAVLRDRNLERAVERMALMAAGWSGGTRIGESLATFNRHHAAGVLNRRTVVMIVSDGYDTGPPERLGEQLRLVKRRARRVVWLNPMIGWQDYQPVAAGMQAALPHIDLFAPAHNLASLAALEPYLAKL
ncbi:MAG: VWA domain-containing protein [Alphaproteobacteria bacterium]